MVSAIVELLGFILQQPMKEEPDWFKCNFTLGQTTSIGCYSGF
jgi:hypothetical protein